MAAKFAEEEMVCKYIVDGCMRGQPILLLLY